MPGLTDIPGLDPALAERLRTLGITTLEGLAAAPVETVLAAGVSAEVAEALRAEARARVAVEDESTRAATPTARDREG